MSNDVHRESRGTIAVVAMCVMLAAAVGLHVAVLSKLHAVQSKVDWIITIQTQGLNPAVDEHGE